MAQNMMTPLATSLLQFQLKKMFKNMVCISGLFGLATVLATFKKILGFFPIHLVTLTHQPPFAKHNPASLCTKGV
jgi:hypothetical protein